MVLVFDLDDTLYDELTFVRRGLRAVAEWGEAAYGWDAAPSYRTMSHLLATKGRGRIFNDWLQGRGCVRTAVHVYRHHRPRIALWGTAAVALAAVRSHPCYLVTDGHKIVQANKIEALRLTDRFKHAYITNRYGRANAKPSTYCFDLIRRREGCEWSDMAYVADNPAKDFVSLNPLGVHTVRVLTGQYRGVHSHNGFEARHRIRTLSTLPRLIERLS